MLTVVVVFIENKFNRDWAIGPPIPCARRGVSGGPENRGGRRGL